MRIAKKFIAVLLVALSLMSFGVMSASAAEAPEFKLEVVSETNTEVTVRFSLVKGAISAFDATFTTSSAIKACSSIKVTDAFNQFKTQFSTETGASILADVYNTSTKKVAFISTVPVDKATSIYDVVFTKKSSAKVTAQDIGVVIDSCVITTTNSYGVTTNVDITDSVKVTAVFGSFAFNTKDYSVSYKTNFTLDFETSYALEDLTWTSSDEGVARVDEAGFVTTTGKGSAEITVKNAAGEVLDTCTVNVSYTFGQWLIIIFLFGWLWY